MNHHSPNLRELRGARLAALLAIHGTPRPASLAWLEGETGYSTGSLMRALGYLGGQGLARSRLHGWALTNAGRVAAIGLALGMPTPVEKTTPLAIQVIEMGVGAAAAILASLEPEVGYWSHWIELGKRCGGRWPAGGGRCAAAPA